MSFLRPEQWWITRVLYITLIDVQQLRRIRSSEPSYVPIPSFIRPCFHQTCIYIHARRHTHTSAREHIQTFEPTSFIPAMSPHSTILPCLHCETYGHVCHLSQWSLGRVALLAVRDEDRPSQGSLGPFDLRPNLALTFPFRYFMLSSLVHNHLSCQDTSDVIHSPRWEYGRPR